MALEHYQQAQKLLPHKIKLKEIIIGLENELKAKATKKKPAQTRPAWGHTAVGPKINKRLALGNVSNTGTGGNGNGNGKTKRKASKVDDDDAAASDPEWEPLENDNDDTFELKPKKKKGRSSKTPTPNLDTPEPEPPVELDPEAKAAFAVKLVSLLNNGDIKQLLKMAGVGKKRAENIISFREKERTFNKIDDLRYSQWPPRCIWYPLCYVRPALVLLCGCLLSYANSIVTRLPAFSVPGSAALVRRWFPISFPTT